MYHLLGLGLAFAGGQNAPPLAAAPEDVHTAHLLFSHHLDVGLNIGLDVTEFCLGFATKIVQEYFDDFIPRAIRLANELRDGPDRFVYTVHPWIVSLYVDCVPWSVPDGCPLNPGLLRCPSEAQVAAFDAAVRRGDLVWADSPMNLNSGVVGEPGMFEALVDIAGALNERYNLTKLPRVWANIDVPGFARSSIPLLRRAGVSALSICANVGGNGADSNSVPLEFVGRKNATMFRWHDPVSDAQILVLYHRAQHDTLSEIPLASPFNTYGGFTRADNTLVTPTGTAFASFIGADNSGPPQTAFEVRRIFRTTRALFPKAKVFGSTWSRFVADITAEEVAALPQVSSEWGDMWLVGMATDPGRLATYRALARARAACVASGVCDAHDAVLRNFTRFAAKNAEHTQGVQGNGNAPGQQLCIWTTALHLFPGHFCHGDIYWANEQFATIHNTAHNIYHGADDSWLEDRLFNRLAVEAVPASHPLAAMLHAELAALEPLLPAAPARPLTPGAPPPTLTCRGAEVRFTASGSIASLSFGGAGHAAWTGLMDLRYITSRHCGSCTCKEAGCANPVPGAWAPSLLGVWSQSPSSGGGAAAGGAGGCHISLELGFNETLARKYGAPARVIVRYELDPDARRLNATLTWLNKTATRLPEALTLFHRPAPRAGHAWAVDTLGEWVSPANVTPGGEQWKHAVWSGIRYASSTPKTSHASDASSGAAAVATAAAVAEAAAMTACGRGVRWKL